jgi:perosamine synthetase
MSDAPKRAQIIPYGRQAIDEDDIAAVVAVLRSDWLTTGPTVERFEEAVATFTGSQEAVAVNSGTAGLHAAMHALGIGPGDEVIVPAMTFAATANCVVYQGGTPIFADVDPETLLLSPGSVIECITSRTRAMIAVDYAGQPCDYDALSELAQRHGLALVADACHSLGARYKGRPVGSLAQMTVFSFHPVKHITTGEGGMIVTNDPELAKKLRRFRNHGITLDHRQREKAGSWVYEMVDLGYNYRITDFQCALGISQLSKLPDWLARRRQIAKCYDDAFAGMRGVRSLKVVDEVEHAYHLYVIRVNKEVVPGGRAGVFTRLREQGIGVNVHYIPVHLHPFYRQQFGTRPGLCPNAEAVYEEILSLPMFPRLSDGEVDEVIAAVAQAVDGRARSARAA